jgi:hypothetical protein
MKPRLAASLAHAYIAFGQVERASERAARCHVSGDDDLHLMTEFQRMIVARVLIAQHSPHARSAGWTDCCQKRKRRNGGDA